MNERYQTKLRQLIAQRADNMKAIRQFDELFFKFADYILKEVVKEINYELQDGGTDDILKLMFDDPYSNKRNPYYVQVQYFVGINRRDLFLNNTKNNPAILFEGYDFNAKVKISFKTQNDENFKLHKEIPIQLLTQEETINILIAFLENVYKR